MAVLDIHTFGDTVLRIKASSIEKIDDTVETLFDDMVETMQANEGIGLAAPQVGHSLQMFVVDMGLIEENGKAIAVINPEILETKGEQLFEEGCLSVPDIREEVKRPEIIKIKYQDIAGNTVEEEIAGLKARVFQHEYDHLQGVLFIDRISSIKRKLLHKKLKTIARK